MKTEEQLEKEFRKDLSKLLKKYNADIELSQRGGCYMHYDVIEVIIEATYDDGLNKLSPYVEFDL